MNTQVGVVKQTSGVVIAVDANGNLRVLNVGDAIFLGEVVKTQGAGSNAIFSMYNGKELSVLENDTVAIDQSMISNKSFGVDSVADLTDLQRAILAGGDLTQLEETAAGAGGGLNAGGETSRLNEAYFISGGHDSNVNVNSTESIVDSVFAFANPIGSIGTAANVLENEPLPKPNETVTVSANDKGGASNAVTDATAANDPVINPIKNNDTKITGKVNNPDPNTSVTVTFPDNSTATVAVDPNTGIWEVSTPNNKPLNPGDTVTVTSKDKSGESSPVADVIAPTIIINSVTPQDTNSVADGVVNNTKVVGISDPNTPVVIKNVNGDIVGNGQTDASGNFEIITTQPINTGESITVEVTDKAGNKGSTTGVAGNIEFSDTTAPSVSITVDSITDDNIVNIKESSGNKKVNVTGTVSGEFNQGDTVKITVNGNEYTGKTGSDGRFSIQVLGSDLVANISKSIQVSVTTQDKAGNETEAFATKQYDFDTDHVSVIYDTLTIYKQTDDSQTGYKSEVKFTVSEGETPTFNFMFDGNSPISAPVKVGTENGRDVYVATFNGEVNKNGLVSGTVSDAAGNMSKLQTKVPMTLKEVVDIKITSVEDDTDSTTVALDSKGKNPITKDTTPTIKGITGVPNSVVEIYDGNNKIGSVTSDNNGNFTFTVTTALTDGNHNFTAKVSSTDANGATMSSTSSTYDVNVDSIAPNVTIESVTPKDTDAVADGQANKAVVTGISEPNMNVVVKDNNGNEIGSGMTGADGRFSIETTQPVNSGDSITVEVTDNAGNKGNITTTKDYTVDNVKSGDSDDKDITTPTDNTNVDTTAGLKVESISEVYKDDSEAEFKYKKDVVISADNIEDARNIAVKALTGTMDSSFTKEFTISPTIKDGKVKFTLKSKQPNALDKITIEATATDEAGNTASLNYSYAKPTITSVVDDVDGGKKGDLVTGDTTNDNTPTIKGTATPNSTIKIYDSDTELGQARVNQDGKFEFTPTTPLDDGIHKFKVVDTIEVPTSEENVTKVEPKTFDVTIDTSAPTVTITIESITDDNIISSSEASGNVTVKGSAIGAKNGDTVTVSIDDNISYTTTIGDDGSFSVSVPGSKLASDTDKTIRATITTTNDSGNSDSAETTKTYQVDTTGPVVDITHMYKFIPTTGEQPYKANIYFTVNDTTATVTTSDATLDGKQAVSVTKIGTKGGKDEYLATFDNPTHTSNVTITATDLAGNKGSATDSLKTGDIKVDVVIRSIEDNVKGGIDGALSKDMSMVTTPEGETIIGNLTNDSTPTIKGRTAIPNSLVKIYDNDKVVATTISDYKCEFSIELPAQKDGYHSFKASVESDGRTSITKEFQVFIDTQADISLNVSASSKNANQDYVRTISGKADSVGKDQTITIKDEANGKTITTKVVDDQGNYSVEVNYGKNKPQVGKVLVSVKDKTGNEATNEVMTEAAQTKVVISQQDKGLTGKVYKYTGHPVYELWEKNGNSFKDVTSSKRGDVTDILQKGGFILGQAAVQGSHFQGKQIHNKLSPIYSDKLKTIETRTNMGGSKSDSWDTIYHYKGKVAMSGVQNKLYAKFYEIDTAVVVKIDGKIVYGFVTKDNSSINTHNYKDVNVNLNGEHDIEVIIIQASYRKEGTIQVGVVGENNEHVILGYNKGGVKTSFVDTTKLPDDAEYNVEEGSYMVTGTAHASSSLKNIKTTDDDDNVTGTQKNEFFDATKGNDIINAGGGNDRIEVDVDSLDGKTKLDGGNGYDTLLLEAPGSNVDLSKVGLYADHFEAIDLKYGNQGTTLTVNVMDVLSVTNDPNVLFKISGDGQDTVSGKGQWTRADDQSGTDDGYTKYQGTADTGHTVFIQVEDTIKTDF